MYANVVASFQLWWVALFYVVAMILLGFHLYHGAWSSVRTLGFERGRLDPFHRPVAITLAIIVWAGFTLVPVAVSSTWCP